jgi:hypothetical protein
MTRPAPLLAHVALVGGCGNDGPDLEVCGNGFDDDADALVDCRDPDCAGPSCVEQCVDQIDNDGDDLADCADPDCDGGCPEECTDTRDNDADGAIDCADDECIGVIAEVCGDGVDNDCDTFADCDDADCDGGCPETCTDNRDNDGDGALDCDDPDCDGDPACPERCLDGRDNDGDGDFDCDDEQCDASCDLDGDGDAQIAGGGTDCDDSRADVHVGAEETCNGVDDDCDGLADDDDPEVDGSTKTRYYDDDDQDGYGDTFLGLACAPPAGMAVLASDCDDLDPDVHPGAPEVCSTPDDDCDGLTDDEDPTDLDPRSASEWFEDVDGDGYGDPDVSMLACVQPEGFADNDDDCHLFDPTITLESEWWPDLDGDGYGAGVPVVACVQPVGMAHESGDCNDADAGLHPGALGVAWSSLVAAWQANGESIDGTGLLGPATLVGDASYGPGRYDEAFLFDGVGDQVQTGFSWQAPFTISLWVQPSVLPQPDAGVFATAPDVTSDATFELRLVDPAGLQVHTNLTDFGAGSVTLGWSHIAVAFDGSDLHTWAGGVPVVTAAWGAAEPPDMIGLTLGADRTGALSYGGLLDDVLVFDRALSDAEIAALADGTATCLAL